MIPALATSSDSLRSRLEAVLKTGAVLTRFRDTETAAHVERVSRYARLVARSLAHRWGLTDGQVEAIGVFAAVHDIGKIAVPETLLGKRGPLDLAESELVRRHTTAGADMVDRIVSDLELEGHAHLSILRAIVRSHHELLDGSGYPDGLGGDEIPCEARIVAVADIYDALRSVRVYKEPWTHEEAIGYLRSVSGTQLDPECVEALAVCVLRMDQIRQCLADEVTGRAPDPPAARSGTLPGTIR